MRRIRLALVLSIIFVLAFPISKESSQHASEASSMSVIQLNEHLAAWTNSSPINITSNEDFALQGWPGSGVVGDPYRIENLSVVSDGNCISVDNTTAHFVISNCFLSSMSHDIDDIFDESACSGVYLFNVSNCRIVDCTIQYKYYGCEMYWPTSNCTITGNDFSYCFHSGVFSAGASYCNIMENTFSHNLYALELLGGGGYTPKTRYFTISSNIMTHNGYGIDMNIADSCVIDNNIIENGVIGINGDHYNMTVRNNQIDIMSDTGILVGSWSWGLIQSNQISNIDGTGLKILSVDNLTVSNNLIEHCDNGIISTGEFVLLEWNNISFHERGFELQDCHDCVLRYNLISDNEWYGFYLSGTTFNNSVYYNTFIKNEGDNARDYGDNNIWDDEVSRGNVWDDYIGYSMYIIPGYSRSVDKYPDNPEHGLRFDMIIPPIGIGLVSVSVVILFLQRRDIVRAQSLQITNTG